MVSEVRKLMGSEVRKLMGSEVDMSDKKRDPLFVIEMDDISVEHCKAVSAWANSVTGHGINVYVRNGVIHAEFDEDVTISMATAVRAQWEILKNIMGLSVLMSGQAEA